MVDQPSKSGSGGGEERVLYDDRPHPVFIVTQSWRWIVFGVLIWGLLIWLDGQQPGYGLVFLGWGVMLLVLIRLVFAAIDRAVRVHRLTDRRIVSRFGILSTVRSEMKLDKVQHIVVVRTLVERLFGIGAVGVSSAGTGNVEIVWRGVERPERIREMIQDAVDGVERSGPKMGVMPVIGLVGGIGSGKSTVAKAFEDLGCVVSDSDKSGAKALQSPGVVEELVSWWGDEILDESGAVDRKKVAQIVFADPEARKKLEGLVHPLIHRDRHELIEKARKDGGIRAVIVDAPLLYEAGVESECDAVIFVQTPKRMRVQRVSEGRGWDESELDRREKAQLGLEQKRDRADYVVANGGPKIELPAQVSRILEEIERNMGAG
jgi:dephospho-CoA kinase